jgi:hypothetical protein
VPRLVLFLLAADLLAVVLGLVLVWLGVAAPAPHWNDLARSLVTALGLGGTALFVGVGLGAIRSNVLGLPPVRVQPDGVWIAGRRIDWSRIGRVDAVWSAGIPWLTAEVPSVEIRFLPWYDRLSARIQVPRHRRAREIWMPERQLGAPVVDVLRVVPAAHRHP